MKSFKHFLMSLSLVFAFTTGCGTVDPNEENESEVTGTGYAQSGMASYYGVGDGFHGRRTANGERFDAYGLTAAHRTLRFGSCLLVTNLYNGKKTKVRVNDRGPYSGGRIIDLSYGAAKAIGMVSSGTAQVRIEGVSCAAPTASSSAIDDASNSTNTVATDNSQCKVFLTASPAEDNQFTFTVQSRVVNSDRPCGKSVKILGSGSSAQGKEIASVEMTAGDGRKTIKVPLSALEGLSHLFAQAVNSKGERMGESEAKNLQLTADL